MHKATFPNRPLIRRSGATSWCEALTEGRFLVANVLEEQTPRGKVCISMKDLSYSSVLSGVMAYGERQEKCQQRGAE